MLRRVNLRNNPDPALASVVIRMMDDEERRVFSVDSNFDFCCSALWRLLVHAAANRLLSRFQLIDQHLEVGERIRCDISLASIGLNIQVDWLRPTSSRLCGLIRTRLVSQWVSGLTGFGLRLPTCVSLAEVVGAVRKLVAKRTLLHAWSAA